LVKSKTDVYMKGALDVKKGEKLVVQLNLNDKMLVGNT
jgi:hypothetical protein